MTINITIEEATNNLLDLLDRVSQGEEIIILKDGQQIARLLPALPTLPPRVPGTAAGMIKIAPDFDQPLPDDILEAFEA
ncbi:toxin-antitoxin system, antitoxin component, PHD family protein [Calothrix sp. NIES-4071]|nr:toxin-antitoxin system, antitoxin component, PHD family protein [Calothrix sp. NIES-4071]BAZ62689.1 toxin-antitoxin system, antitoxin component, PHD family protein [Calothrix sp. NIES-4105]